MIPKITEKVEVGAVIRTDQHKTYLSLSAHGHEHRTVNHSEKFKASDGTHTNHVVSQKISQQTQGFPKEKIIRNVDSITSYIDDFMWLERHRRSKWRDFLAAVEAVPPTRR